MLSGVSAHRNRYANATRCRQKSRKIESAFALRWQELNPSSKKKRRAAESESGARPPTGMRDEGEK